MVLCQPWNRPPPPRKTLGLVRALVAGDENALNPFGLVGRMGDALLDTHDVGLERLGCSVRRFGLRIQRIELPGQFRQFLVRHLPLNSTPFGFRRAAFGSTSVFGILESLSRQPSCLIPLVGQGRNLLARCLVLARHVFKLFLQFADRIGRGLRIVDG